MREQGKQEINKLWEGGYLGDGKHTPTHKERKWILGRGHKHRGIHAIGTPLRGRGKTKYTSKRKKRAYGGSEEADNHPMTERPVTDVKRGKDELTDTIISPEARGKRHVTTS